MRSPAPWRRAGRGRTGALATIAAAALTTNGCMSAPERVDAVARELGYTRAVLRGADFSHVLFRNDKYESAGVLHVYIEGDGSPYLDRHSVAADPTPRHPLMLRLMAMDMAPAVYIGRPCYFGLAADPPCTARDWTLDRFGVRVVDSLARVIGKLRPASDPMGIALFGHSGGGALAVLVAARLPDVRRVVTLAGNLDPDAWTAYHRYTPLDGSLNPAREGPLPSSVLQQHFAGDRDRDVPSWMVRDAATRIGATDINVLRGVTHTCCWEKLWPAILTGR